MKSSVHMQTFWQQRFEWVGGRGVEDVCVSYRK